MIKVCLECGEERPHTMDTLACDDHFPSEEETFELHRKIASLIFGVKL